MKKGKPWGAQTFKRREEQRLRRSSWEGRRRDSKEDALQAKGGGQQCLMLLKSQIKLGLERGYSI